MYLKSTKRVSISSLTKTCSLRKCPDASIQVLLERNTLTAGFLKIKSNINSKDPFLK